MKKTLIVILSVAIPIAASAQSHINRIESRAERRMKEILDKAQTEQDRIMDDYERKSRMIMEEYKAYYRKIMKKWGDSEIVESTKKDWVEYSKDESSRSIVDFEEGKVTVEVLTEPSDNEDSINQKLEKAIGDLLASKGKTPGFDSEILPQEDISDKPILDEQIDLEKYKESPQETIPEAIIKEEKKEKKTVDTEEGRKEVVSIQLELVEDHIPKRAERFKDMIRKYSERFGVNEPLIYAIMEQESYFNPMAKSHAGAYGLMQIVPSSGGLDANRHVHNRNEKPTPRQLYVPDFNIELGTGYLDKQMRVYFKGVNDPRCRMLCAIAAYNTGQGNVYHAFTGKRKPEGAIKAINGYSYDKLYEYLKSHLPHAETRDYIQKVTSKMQKYSK